ncbi:MAG: ATP-binding cassette domain-containing protein [Hyphomicrobiaceae bacterium]
MREAVLKLDVAGHREAAGAVSRVAPPRLGVEELVYEVGGRRLIDGATVTLAPDTRTVVMGPNGSGKSLLMRLVTGLIQPTAGRISWDGAPLDEAMRKRQALVFQRPVLLRRSVAENLDFVLRLRGRAEPARRDALLAEVGLEGHARQPARLLSGGEQQRLALARALATEPAVLVLDEPTANLDPASTHLIEEIVGRAHDRGTKVIWVTHDIGQARRLADDIVFLSAGRIATHAPAAMFFARPATEAARAYLEGRIHIGQ